jgi:hypothetical protein
VPEYGTKAKVGNFEPSSNVQQEILWLEIAMAYALVMNVLLGKNALLESMTPD